MMQAGRRSRFDDLWVRAGSAMVLAVIAFIDFWHGGIYVTGLLMLVAAVMIWEYRRLVLRAPAGQDKVLWLMVIVGVAAILMVGVASLSAGVLLLGLGLLGVAWADPGRRIWMVLGLAYIVIALAVLIDIRRDPALGFPVVLWLVSVVIATDMGGYFAGRALGGPRLWPRVSPNKTWAGAIGGLAFAAGTGVLFARSGQVPLEHLVLLSLLIGLAAQAGDLLQSRLKRRFGAKDTSALIPGHGGVLDRFDGLLGALWAFWGVSAADLVTG